MRFSLTVQLVQVELSDRERRRSPFYLRIKTLQIEHLCFG